MFSCEFCEISNNTFYTENFRTTASSMGARERGVSECSGSPIFNFEKLDLRHASHHAEPNINI